MKASPETTNAEMEAEGRKSWFEESFGESGEVFLGVDWLAD